jgi:hypothetical protein
MQRVGEHPVPAGPLAVRWLGYSLGEQRAGVTSRVRLRLANAGSAPWRSSGREGVQLSYHWLDPLGNAIVWDGPRTSFEATVQPGDEVELEANLVAPRPPGSYRLAFDLVSEYRYWFEEVGSATLDLPVDVRARIDARRLAVEVHGGPDPGIAAALAAQEEAVVTEDAVAVAHLVPGAIPDPDWSRLLLDAHEEGFVAVGPAIDARERSARRRLAAWAPGGGRNPRFGLPLLLPSLLAGVELETHDGLPAYGGSDALFEGRAVVRLRSRSGRPTG